MTVTATAAAAAQALLVLRRCKTRSKWTAPRLSFDSSLRAGYEGGKHQGGWGTENVIIPLGQGYLEIAAVFDPVAAQTCDWGKCVYCTVEQLTSCRVHGCF